MNSSEFKIKGTGLASTKKFFYHKYGEGYFLTSWNKYYPGTTLLTSSWYDMDPIVNWMYDLSKETSVSFRELVLLNTKYVLETDLNGVYRFFMKLGGVIRVLDFSPQLAKTYSNCLNLKNIENTEGYYRAEVVIPSKYSEFTVFGQEGSLDGILKVCGKKMREFKILSNEITIKDGIEFSKISYELKYN